MKETSERWTNRQTDKQKEGEISGVKSPLVIDNPTGIHNDKKKKIKKSKQHFTPPSYLASTKSIPFPNPNLVVPPDPCVSPSSTNNLRDTSNDVVPDAPAVGTPEAPRDGLRTRANEGEGGGGSSCVGAGGMVAAALVFAVAFVSCEDDEGPTVNAGVVVPPVPMLIPERLCISPSDLPPPTPAPAPANKTRPMDPGARRATVGRAGDGLVARYNINSAASASSVAFPCDGIDGAGVLVRGGCARPSSSLTRRCCCCCCRGDARLNMSAVSVAAAFMSSFSVTVLRARLWRTVRTVRP